MKESYDLVKWIIGVLTTLVFFGWRYDKRETDKKLNNMSEKQNEVLSRLSVAETKVDNLLIHYMKTLEDIKTQQNKMATDVTSIKIAIARIPKRKED